MFACHLLMPMHHGQHKEQLDSTKTGNHESDKH